MSGILNWALEGCLEWQKEGLDIPDEVKRATEEYRVEMDVLGEFLTACCEFEETAVIPNKMLYTAYQLWCMAGAEKPENQMAFSRRVEERGYAKERQTKGMIWKGIRLNQEVLDILAKMDNEPNELCRVDVGCRVMKAFRGFSTHISYIEKNPKNPTQPYIEGKPYTTNQALGQAAQENCGICGNPLNGNAEPFGFGLGKIHPSCKFMLVKVRILKDIQQFTGIDNRIYGTFKAEDIADIPIINALPLISKHAAERVA